MNQIKGAVHIHSDFEEGSLDLSEILLLHKTKESSFVFLTEHNRIKNKIDYKKRTGWKIHQKIPVRIDTANIMNYVWHNLSWFGMEL